MHEVRNHALTRPSLPPIQTIYQKEFPMTKLFVSALMLAFSVSALAAEPPAASSAPGTPVKPAANAPLNLSTPLVGSLTTGTALGIGAAVIAGAAALSSSGGGSNNDGGTTGTTGTTGTR
jgi:hypothetical protein